MQLLENWCDVVTAWCEGNYLGSDVLYSLELFQVFEGNTIDFLGFRGQKGTIMN